MDFFRNIVSCLWPAPTKASPIPADWQELRITTARPPPNDAGLAQLLDDVKTSIAAAGAGQYDEHEELADGQICVYLLGPSADHLLEAVTPVLRRHVWTSGAELYRAYGNTMDPTTVEVITLHAP